MPNPLFEAIEDEYVKALEQGLPVPTELELSEHEFMWLIALGMFHNSVRVKQRQVNEAAVKLGGVDVTLRRAGAKSSTTYH